MVAPFGTRLLLGKIETFILWVEDGEILRIMIRVIRNILAFSSDLKVREEVLEKNFALRYGGDEAVQLISLYPERAQRTRLVSSCVTHFLNARYSPRSIHLIELLKKGLDPGEFDVPVEAKDPMNINLALALFSGV
jgi:hypothetical protein